MILQQHHIFVLRDWFQDKDFTELPSTTALVEDKDSTCKVIGKGTLKILVKDFNTYIPIILINVLNALINVRTNLIGVNLDIAGNKVIWENNKMIMYDRNNEYIVDNGG